MNQEWSAAEIEGLAKAADVFLLLGDIETAIGLSDVANHLQEKYVNEQIRRAGMTDKIGNRFTELRESGWMLYYFGTHDDVAGLGAARLWPKHQYGEVVIVHNVNYAVAYRTVLTPTLKIFTPDMVFWTTVGSAAKVLNQAVRLREPKGPHYKQELNYQYEAPPYCAVPSEWPEPVELPPRLTPPAPPAAPESSANNESA
ncbi:hypothetical protein [Amycolatopsis sp. NPDC059021]|uniref:hypothetical protein n=1 Tax=Amycolatopsis sp. NPDC059021 TaxID=3346704 RepID=UPI00367142FB